MRDLGNDAGEGSGGSATALSAPSLAEVQEWTRRVRGVGGSLDDAGRIDLLRALEELGCAVAGAQADVTADFVLSQRAAAAERGCRRPGATAEWPPRSPSPSASR